MIEFKFFIDRGGTFTDVLVEEFDGAQKINYVLKLLSEDPEKYDSAPREAIRQVLWNKFQRQEFQNPFKSFSASGFDYVIKSIYMGTTVATNMLLERKGSKTVFITTKGFGDLLEIGYQNRPEIFSLDIIKPKQLYDSVLEIDERILADGAISLALDENKVREQLTKIQAESLAISLMHSYINNIHELAIKRIAQELGFRHISVSSEILPMIKFVSRSSTTVLDAYLTPGIHRYLKSFREGFLDALANTELLMMKSDGGLTEPENFRGYNSIFSGPAGGMTALSGLFDGKQALIGFDMGGTSTDVARFDGDLDLSFQSELKGFFLQVPQLDIQTIAAGGGSRLFFANGMFRVGPESSGSHPGPVCYRKNGYLSITDANLVLGRLIPEYFPKVFGAHSNQAIDYQLACTEFQDFKQKNSLDKSIEDIAQGFVDIANEVMARPIREVSLMRGFDIRDHVLVCYGGAGAQHACAIARNLGIKKVYIHKYAGIFSAYGLSQAKKVIEKQIPCAKLFFDIKNLDELFSDLIKSLGLKDSNITIKKYLNLRYQGTDTKFSIQEPCDYIQEFKKTYLREFGFDLDKEVVVDDIRIRVEIGQEQSSSSSLAPVFNMSKTNIEKSHAKIYINHSWQTVPVYLFEEIQPASEIQGPAIIIQNTSTIVLEPDSSALINTQGDLEIDLIEKKQSINLCDLSKKEVDPIKLAIYSNRFMSIAEQMGRCLERTAISTNIKERRDFSCAIFDAEGNLIANAPHQPVHLGSMGHAVKKQIEFTPLNPGDVLLTNHPSMGGSHLPDMTVITPVFKNQKIIFFTANRAHHADIGGITPGSMPSFSQSLSQEGIAVKSFKLVQGGEFQEQELKKIFFGSRRLEDNISDLKAQIASNQRGIDLLLALIQESSEQEVFDYMQFIQNNAQRAVREMLINYIHNKNPNVQELVLKACDFLDDGSIINLTIRLNANDGSAEFDFTGTSPELKTNLNTPSAVVSSAILYALRAMIGQEIPLNQGCLAPIKIIIPKNSFLNPSEGAPVVGGNVLSSQRIVDVIFKAFNFCAASQGCMNNISFGREGLAGFGYYETVGGGAGAGPSWHGASGVHTHMTNTRITDPEILESRYPVVLEEFSIRKGSGGIGKFNGGDGLVRIFKFLDDLNLSVLTERRGSYRPYGLEGGTQGAPGENYLQKTNGALVNIGAKNSLQVHPGERLILKTPGGGGFGNRNIPL